MSFRAWATAASFRVYVAIDRGYGCQPAPTVYAAGPHVSVLPQDARIERIRPHDHVGTAERAPPRARAWHELSTELRERQARSGRGRTAPPARDRRIERILHHDRRHAVPADQWVARRGEAAHHPGVPTSPDEQPGGPAGRPNGRRGVEHGFL